MSRLYFLNFRGSRWGDRLSARTLSAFPLLLIMFALGILIGTIVGLFSADVLLSGDLETYVSDNAIPATFLRSLWNAVRFFLVLFLASTSFLGVLFLPAAVLIRGYLFGSFVSALFAAWSYRGLLCSLAVCGLPSLIVIPCFLIAACDAFFLSSRILKMRSTDLSDYGGAAYRHLPFFIFAIVLDAFYSFYVLPSVLGRI